MGKIYRDLSVVKRSQLIILVLVAAMSPFYFAKPIVQAKTAIITTTAHVQNNYTYYLPFLANSYILSGTNGTYTTYAAIQNIGATSATITTTYFDDRGNALTTNASQCATINPQAECFAANPLANGKRGVGTISSNQPLNIIIGEATPFGGTAYLANSQASNVNIIPIAFKNAFGGFNTQLEIYNPGISGQPIINFYDQNGNSIAYNNIPSLFHGGTSTILNLNDPRLGLPDNFSGWATISAGPEIGDELVVQTLEYNQSNHFVATLGQPSGGTTVYAPAIFNKAFGSYVTGISLVNPVTTPLTATITYYDGAGTAYPTDPFTLPGLGSTTIYNGGSGGIGLPSGGLPVGFYGSAIVKIQGQDAVMAVNEIGDAMDTGQSNSGIYSPSGAGFSSVNLPVVANGGFGFTTGLTIQNISSSAISCTVQYYGVDGSVQGNSQTYTIPANASQAIYQGSVDLPPNFYGSAIVTQNSGPSNSLIVTTNAISSDNFYTYLVSN